MQESDSKSDGREQGPDGSPAELSPAEQIDSTTWVILRKLVLRVLLKPHGRSSYSLSEEEQNELLDPFVTDMTAFADMLKRVGHEHYVRGLQDAHNKLHGQPGVDHEMLDEAIEFHFSRNPEDGDGPPIVFE